MAESPLLIPDWPAPASVRAVVTTRLMPGNSRPPYDSFNLGLRSGEDEGIVQANRKLLMRSLKLPASPRWLQQVHGDRSLRLTEEVLEGEPQADAAFTTQRGVVLAILTADCLPILLCADDGTEIVAIHAGWRGLVAGVIECCVRRLRTRPENLLAWIGPGIGAASYEVGTEVHDAMMARDLNSETSFTATRPGHWNCNLDLIARQQLAAMGIERIHGGGFDTFRDARFYSHRRDGKHSGRFASLIWIAP
jgi:polyphenol oxidase